MRFGKRHSVNDRSIFRRSKQNADRSTVGASPHRALSSNGGRVGALSPPSATSSPLAIEPQLRRLEERRRSAREWALATLYLAGLALTFINSRSVWLDEAIGASIAAQPLGAMLQTLQHVDAVHGLYYSLLHVSMLLGQNAIVIPLPSVIFAVLASVAIGKLAKRMFGEAVAAPAVAILATSTFFLYYADEARPAAFTLMTCSFAALGFWRAMASRSTRDIVLCGIFFLFALYANILAIFFLIATCLAVRPAASGALPLSRKTASTMIAAAACICVAIVPLLVTIHENSLAQISWIARSNARQIVYFAASIVGSNEGADRASRIATEFEAIVVLALLTVGAVSGLRCRRRIPSVNAALIWLIVPLIIAIAVDQWVQPILIARYFSFLLIPTALLAGYGLALVRRRFGSAAAFSIVALLSLVTISSLATVRREDWRAVTMLLSRSSAAGDGIVFWTPWTVTPFEFAVREKATRPAATIVYPDGPLTNDVAYRSPSAEFVRAIGRRYNRVWLVESNTEKAPDPFDALSHFYAHRTQSVFAGVVVVSYSH
jgi:mannosyltransferase